MNYFVNGCTYTQVSCVDLYWCGFKEDEVMKMRKDLGQNGIQPGVLCRYIDCRTARRTLTFYHPILYSVSSLPAGLPACLPACLLA